MKNIYHKNRYTTLAYIYLEVMEHVQSVSATISNPSVSSNCVRSNTRKKQSSKQDENEKIIENMEGGIIVRRYKGKKIEIEEKKE